MVMLNFFRVVYLRGGSVYLTTKGKNLLLKEQSLSIKRRPCLKRLPFPGKQASGPSTVPTKPASLTETGDFSLLKGSGS